MAIEVSSKVHVYEVDGCETSAACPVLVESHHVRSSMVVLIAEGVRYTVSVADIRAAIENASNVAR